jgi:hypothetical protein
MPILIAILGGAAVSYLLIESELAIPAFIGMVVFIVLLFVWPTAAWWMLALTVALGLLVALAAMWETVLGIVLGFVMFFFLILGLVHAL